MGLDTPSLILGLEDNVGTPEHEAISRPQSDQASEVAGRPKCKWTRPVRW